MTSRQILQKAIMKVQTLATSNAVVEPGWLRGLLPQTLLLLREGLATMQGEEGSHIDSGTRHAIAIAKAILTDKDMK